jgi:hypothetical protein
VYVKNGEGPPLTTVTQIDAFKEGPTFLDEQKKAKLTEACASTFCFIQ